MLRWASLSGEFPNAFAGRRGLPLHGPHDTHVAVLEARVEEMWRHWLTPFEG